MFKQTFFIHTSKESRLIFFNAEPLHDAENRPEVKTEREQVMAEVRDFMQLHQRFQRATMSGGHDGIRIFRGYYNHNRSNRDNHSNYQEAVGKLENIETSLSVKEIRERIELARKLYEAVEKGLRSWVETKAQNTEEYLRGEPWQKITKQLLSGGVDRENIDAITRAQKLLTDAIARRGDVTELCDRFSILKERIDRVYWQYANPSNQESRLVRFSNPRGRITLARGLTIRRSENGELVLERDPRVWNSLGYANNRLAEELPLGLYMGISRNPDGSWMLWGDNNRSLGDIYIRSTSEEMRKQGYPFQITIYDNLHGGTDRLLPRLIE